MFTQSASLSTEGSSLVFTAQEWEAHSILCSHTDIAAGYNEGNCSMPLWVLDALGLVNDRTLVITLDLLLVTSVCKGKTRPRSWGHQLMSLQQRGAGVLWVPKSCTSTPTTTGQEEGW